MSRRPSDPRCALCGNEEDLRAHPSGDVYCVACWIGLECTHGDRHRERSTCRLCLRQTHSIITFEGWRIADVVAYAIAAFVDHGIKPGDLRTWTFEEREVLEHIEHDAAWVAAINASSPPGGWT